MENEMRNFLVDLVSEIQGKYNQSLIPTTKIEEEEKKKYRLGMNFSYYDVLELIESQLKSFGYSVDEFGEITPILGKEINKNI